MFMTTHVSDALNKKQALRESKRLAKCYSLNAMDTVEDIRRMNLRVLVEQKGSVRAVAELLGKSSAQISQWLNASPDSKTGKPRNISAISARDIEKKLGMPRGLFDQPIAGPTTGTLLRLESKQGRRTAHDEHMPEGAIPLPSGRQRVPVVGTAQLGDDGHWVEMDYPVGHGDGYLDFITSDTNAYALRCKGDSMAPRIKDGEFVVVEPNTAPHPGDEVMVKSEDGRVMVKELLYVRDGVVHLASINAAHGRIAIPVDDIAAMHLVAGIVKRVRWHPD